MLPAKGLKDMDSQNNVLYNLKLPFLNVECLHRTQPLKMFVEYKIYNIFLKMETR